MTVDTKRVTRSDRPTAANDRSARASKLLLAVGFVALVAAVLAARSAPAEGYEVSIYRSTPVAFWVGAAVAMACSLAVGLAASTRRSRAASLLLGGETFLAIVALPLVRGYAFYGAGDALSHIGWMRDVAAGRLVATDIMYPALHTISLFVRAVTGGSLERSAFLLTMTLLLLFAAFVAVSVGFIANDPRATVFGAFSAFLVLPINNVSSYVTVRPSAMALMFVPFVVALLVLYLRETESTGVASTTTIGALLALCSVAITLIHPQQAANLLLLFGTVSTIQFVRRRRSSGETVLRPLYGQTAFLAVVFALWSGTQERVIEAVTGIVPILLFERSMPNEVAQRGDSLVEIGGSLEEVFLKLFLVSTIYLGFTSLLVLASLRGRIGREAGRFGVVPYLSFGSIPVFGLFALYLIGNVQTIYFRHLGFIMVLATVLGAVALYSGTEYQRRRSGRLLSGLTTSVVGMALAVMLVLSLLTLFPSPYVYQPNAQVSDMQLSGHQTAFEHADDDAAMVGIRLGPDRYRDAILGTGELDSRTVRRANGIGGDELAAGVGETYDEPTYVVVTEPDRMRESVAYGNVRYSDRSMATVGAQPGVHRVQSNGEFELYFVGGQSE